MTSNLREYSARIVGLLIIVEAVSVYFLWALNPINQAGEATFAILLAVDLLSLMLISYIYRMYKSEEQFNRGFMLSACVLILVLLYVSLSL